MNDPVLQNFLAKYSPEITELALEVRDVVIATYSSASEMVDPPSNIIVYGTSPKYADLVCAIALFDHHINLMFRQGTSLPDPAGLLTGTGKRARHVRIENIADIQRPEVRELILAAVNLARAVS